MLSGNTIPLLHPMQRCTRQSEPSGCPGAIRFGGRSGIQTVHSEPRALVGEPLLLFRGDRTVLGEEA
jgi:hypothetical protein